LIGLDGRSGLRYSLNEIEAAKGFRQFHAKASRARAAVQQKERTGSGPELDDLDDKAMKLAGHLTICNNLLALEGPLLVPPPVGASGDADWTTFRDALDRAELGRATPEEEGLEAIVRAYGLNDVGKFNKALDDYSALVAKRYPSEASTARFEVFFNNF